MDDLGLVVSIDILGVRPVIRAALELLAEIEDSDMTLLPDELVTEARNLRSVVDEWVEIDAVEVS